MSYKENKNYKKYSSKHKDVKDSVQVLEDFCYQNAVKMELFGSLTRKDYYYGKSDGDAIIITKNIDHTSYQLNSFIRNHRSIEGKKRKLVYYGLDKDKIECSGLLHKVNIHGNNFDIVLIEENDYENHIQLVKPTFHFLLYIVMSIIKFFYYQVPIIPQWLYIESKAFLFKRRLHIVKEESYK